MTDTFQDLLADFADEVFIGREEYLTLLEKAMSASRPPFLILAISGQGGVGKTTLLEQFGRIANQHNALTVFVNESQTSVPEVLAYFAHQFDEAEYPFEAFEKRYHKYRELKEQVEADPKAPKGILDFALRSAARISLRSLNRVPIAGEAIDVLLTPEAEDIVADQVSAIAVYIGQKFSNEDDKVLLLETDQELSHHFLMDLNKYAGKHRIVLFFDTYEKTVTYLDKWLRDLLIGKFGTFNSRVLFVIAGRYPLGQSWTQFKKATQQIELYEFTESEARKYLESFSVTNEAQIKELLKLSNRLPVLLALLSTVSDNMPPTEVAESAVERFLQGTTNDQREIAIVTCVPRFFNLDILRTILGSETIEPSFEWLSHAHFVRSTLDGWAYHDIVRSLMLRYFRLRSNQYCVEIHGKLAVYYYSQAEVLGIAEDKQQEDEMWRKNKIENLYHALCHAPQKNLSMALNGFLAAWKVDRTFARRWIETIQQAGEDSQVEEIQRWSKKLNGGFDAIYNENDYQAAIKMFTNLIDDANLETQWQADVLKRRSYIYNLEGQFSKSLTDLDEALKLVPEEPNYWVARAFVYQSMKQYDDALTSLNHAITLEPEDSGLIGIRIMLLLKKGDITLAASETSKFPIKLDSQEKDWPQELLESPFVTQQIQVMLQRLGFDIDLMGKYMDMFQVAMMNDPETTSLAIQSNIETAKDLSQLPPEVMQRVFGLITQAMGLKSKNIENTLNEIWSNPDAFAQGGLSFVSLLEGDASRRAKQYNQAITAYTKAIESGKIFPELWVNRGEAYRMIKQYEKAITDFDRAIELRPNYEHGLLRKGETYLLMGKYQEALADLNRVLEIDPDRDWCYYQRGLVNLMTGNYDEAQTNLLKAISLATPAHEINSHNWSNTFNLILYYVAANESDLAESLCQQALSMSVSKYIVAEASLLLELLLRLFPNHARAKHIYNSLEEYLLKGEDNAN